MADLTPLSPSAEVRAAQVARTSYGRLVALLASRLDDIASAEDALADAFERALRTWPERGVPDNPEGWLLTVARNRMRDVLRSPSARTTGLDDGVPTTAVFDEIDVEAIPDRRLALLFVCAHPIVDRSIRTPLMLQTVLGYGADQVAGAFALPASTMRQRLVRAKRRIRDAGVPFVVPDRAAVPGRTDAVLEAVYGAYAIDWYEVAGVTRRALLSNEALQLAEVLVELLPDDPEALGLTALICLSLARAPARVDADGVAVPLTDQDTSRWDEALIERGECHLRRAHPLGAIGRFQLEAAIQSVHCNRRVTGVTDWEALRRLHLALHDQAPTLGSAVSLAVVVGELDGPAVGLAVLDQLDGSRTGRFQPAWVARAHLLARAGATTDAIAAYERAISLTVDPSSRAHLARTVDELRTAP